MHNSLSICIFKKAEKEVMKLTAAERGKKIKEARISKKMTQSEVVGDFITRNMLSQIESGIATPSVKTLEYLAETLDIPISELMPSTSPDTYGELYSSYECLVKAKQLLSEGQYAEAAEKIPPEEEWDELEDEFCALSARCFLGLAEKLSEDDAVQAVDYAKKAAELAEKGIYANPALKSEAASLLKVLAERLAKYYSGLISSDN